MARWLAPLLCMLVCPLVMVGMMWRPRRDGGTQPLAHQVQNAAVVTGSTTVAATAPTSGWVRRLWCAACLNWRVIAGLAVVAGVVALVSPGALVLAGPVLLVLACPLSMLVAMVAMRRGRADASSTHHTPVPWSSGTATGAPEATTTGTLSESNGPITTR